MAFELVCPERIDLIHKNYRKLCNLLVDVDEWGQVTMLNMLTRYARTQFIDPNKTVRERERERERGRERERERDELISVGSVLCRINQRRRFMMMKMRIVTKMKMRRMKINLRSLKSPRKNLTQWILIIDCY